MTTHPCRFLALWLTTLAVVLRGTSPGRFALDVQGRRVLELRVPPEDGSDAEGPRRGDVNTTELTIVMTFKVVAVTPDGSAEATLAVDRVHSEIRPKSTGASIRYDSAADPATADAAAKPLRLVYGAAVGATYRLTIDARGRVVAAEVPKAVSEAVRGSAFVGVADGGSVLSEAGLKNLFAQLFPLPAKPVKAGDVWASERTLPTTPFRGIARLPVHPRRARPGLRHDQGGDRLHDPGRAGAPFGVEVRSQDGSASYRFDRSAGRLRDSQVEQKIRLNLTFLNRDVAQEIRVSERMARLP